MSLIFFSKLELFLLQIKIPSKFNLTCFISSKIITGLSLARLSNITFGAPSVKDGRIKIS